MSWKFLSRYYVFLQAQVLIAGCAQAAEPEVDEPPLSFSLIVDGKPMEIIEDKPYRLKGEFKSPEVVIKVDPHKTFTYSGVHFRYPRKFIFETKVLADGRVWRMTGKDCQISLFDVKGDIALADWVQEISDAHRRTGDWETLDAELSTKFGKSTLKGVNGKATAANTALTLSIYRIETKGGRTRFLILQDDPKKRKQTEEAVATFSLLQESFVITRK